MENQNININETQIMTKKEHDFRNIMLTIVGVLVILAAVSGATFAYYAFSATNTTSISGEAATAELTLGVTDSASASSSSLGDGPLVPQPATTITQALVGTSGVNCVDGNGNTVCRVYQITITNSSSAAVYIRGYLKFTTAGKFQNLKWLLLGQTGTSYSKYTSTANVTYGLPSSSGTNITTATTATAVSGTVTSTTTEHGDLFLTSTDIAVGASKNYYIVVWINETGTAQNSTDYGTFTGVVYVESADGKGLTSTFTAST